MGSLTDHPLASNFSHPRPCPASDCILLLAGRRGGSWGKDQVQGRCREREEGWKEMFRGERQEQGEERLRSRQMGKLSHAGAGLRSPRPPDSSAPPLGF